MLAAKSKPTNQLAWRQWREVIDTPMGSFDVHCTAGSSVPSRMLVVLHGKDRAAERYCRQWREAGDRHDLLIVAPKFDRTRFPTWRDYNLAGMLDRHGRLRPRVRWLFPTFDEICSEMCQRHGIARFDLFGHSAGAQFLFRHAMFSRTLPHSSKIIVANAGWYTVPNLSAYFPYGLAGAAEDVHLRSVFGRSMTLLAGGRDIDGNHHSLRKDIGARRQGIHRLARAQYCFEEARETASNLDIPFRWQLKILPQAAHSNADIAPAALALLFDERVED